MNPIHNASSALVQYLDSLLLDEVVPSNEGLHALNHEQNDEKVEKAAVSDDADKNVLRLLLFKAGEIPLAITQQSIDKVVEVSRSSLELVASNDGMLVRQFSYNGQVVGILDVRDIILPDGHPSRQVTENDGNAYVLMFKGAGCGLLCDYVGDEVELGRQEVEWRSQRSSRLWLAGMVKASKHALLDDKEILLIADRVLNS